MKILTSFDELRTIQANIVYALGTFDGIHLGHQTVIGRAVDMAHICEAVTVVVTFDAHPLSILAPQKVPPQLLQREHRPEILEALGVDYMLELPMNADLLSITASDFLVYLTQGVTVRGIVVGENFTFGKGGIGTPALIRDTLEPKGINVTVMRLEGHEAVPGHVSSTYIRGAIARGDVALVRTLLGRAYRFTGTVIMGDQRGRTLGFPTLNFLFPKEMALPADGVYVNRVCIDGEWFGGVGNMGDNPTFANQYHRFEVHLFDFDRDVYGATATVEFLQFLRGEVKFSSLDELITQMKIDEQQAREYLASMD